MSRAGTNLLKERDSTQEVSSSKTLHTTQWTGPMDSSTVSKEIPHISIDVCSEVYTILNAQARAVAASFYQIAQQLSQTTVTSVRLIQSAIYPHLSQESNIWVDMPPHSFKNVVMNVERMGRGEPLDFPNEFVEE